METLKENVTPVLKPALISLQSKSAVELLSTITAIIVIPLFSWYAFTWSTSPLRGIPGPSLAGWTNLWRLHAAYSNRYPLLIRDLHKKHGPVVRVGPNTVTLDFPELIKTIYGTDGRFRKTEFYAASSAVVAGRTHYTLFGEPDSERHATMKRPVAKYYTAGAALALEPQMDRAISELLAQLDARYATNTAGGEEEVCDLWRWSLYLAWDLSSYIIFSRRFGYLEKGCDFDGTIALSATVNRYFELVGQIPRADFWLDKNPILKIGPGAFTNLMKLAVEGYAARVTGRDKEYYDPESPDYLQHFIDAKAASPDVVDDGAVVAFTMLHVIAGADTTAIVVSTVVYYLLRHPDVLARLVAEVRGAGFDKGRPVPYGAARRELRYLDAVWLEVSRLQPVAGMRMFLLLPSFLPVFLPPFQFFFVLSPLFRFHLPPFPLLVPKERSPSPSRHSPNAKLTNPLNKTRIRALRPIPRPNPPRQKQNIYPPGNSSRSKPVHNRPQPHHLRPRRGYLPPGTLAAAPRRGRRRLEREVTCAKKRSGSKLWGGVQALSWEEPGGRGDVQDFGYAGESL